MNLQENIQRIREMMISEEMVQSDAWKSIKKTIDILKEKKKVLLLSCSNRYNWDKNDIDVPKSKMLAMYINDELGDKSVLIDVPELKILPCEGNVSRKDGDSCGVKKAKLEDKDKNPSGHHRCWVNINEPSDELWKISKELFESDAVIFFSSVRWGQANMFYQNLFERKTTTSEFRNRKQNRERRPINNPLYNNINNTDNKDNIDNITNKNNEINIKENREIKHKSIQIHKEVMNNLIDKIESVGKKKLKEIVDVELDLQRELAFKEDFKEGVIAHSERRRPVFKGK